MTGLHPRAVISALGIEAVLESSRTLSAPNIGSPPAIAEAVWLDGRAVVATPDGVCAWGDALHEAIHLALGQETMTYELGMLAVEWAVAQEMAAPWFTEWRITFASYGFSWSYEKWFGAEIGHTDLFLHSRKWADAVADAHERGWLVDGRPVWGMGVHPSILAMSELAYG